jgi:UPF0716 family protein affecting phage T7 exclusion
MANASFFSRLPAFRFRWTSVLLLVAAWIIVEWVIFSAIARQIGLFTSVFLYIIKGGLGLLLLAVTARRVGARLSGPVSVSALRDGAGDLFAALAACVLIAIPGILPMLAGLALFAPSVRRRIARGFVAKGLHQARQDRHADPDSIDLEPGEWQRR